MVHDNEKHFDQIFNDRKDDVQNVDNEMKKLVSGINDSGCVD